MSLNLSVYSKYRTQIMGLAAIMIIVCHIRGVDYSRVPYFEKIIWLGNYGVELFLFVSGIGMYYSLNHKESLVQWYKRRFLRIMVPFMLTTIILYPLRFVFGIHTSLSDFLLNVTTLEYWLYHRGAWYVAMLFPLYILTPISVHILKSERWKYVAMIFTIVVLLLVSYIHCDNNVINNIQFVTLRVPMYILGICVAPLVQTECEFNQSNVCIVIIIGALLWHYCGLSLGGGIVIVLLIGYLINILVKNPLISRLLQFMGNISLESYLTNIYLGHIIMKSEKLNFFSVGIKIMTIIVLGILSAYILNKLSKSIIIKIK